MEGAQVVAMISKDSEIDSRLNAIKVLTKKRKYVEALELCADSLGLVPEARARILRARAHIFALLGDYASAVEDREVVLRTDSCGISDFFRAGENAVFALQHERAEAFLCHTLEMGRQQFESWFEAASLFLLAHVRAQLGKYGEALVALEQAVAIESEVALPLPGSCGLVTHSQLRQEIDRQMRQKASQEWNSPRCER